MEDVQLFIYDSSPSTDSRRTLNNNYDFSSNGYFEGPDYSGIDDPAEGDGFEEIGTELEKREKELFLCSELGLFLAQEIEELLAQQKNLVNDHTRVLLDLQSYEASKNSFLDLADAQSEFNDSVSTLSCFSPDSELSSELQFLKHKLQHGSTSTSDNLDKLAHLQSQIFSLGKRQSHDTSCKSLRHGPRKNWLDRLEELHGHHSSHGTLKRSGSLDSFSEVQSIPESTLTTFSSVTKNLQTDLDKLQLAHDQITRLEVQLDSTRANYRKLMTEYSRKLKEISQSLGACVDKARPYFNAVQKARKAQMETQQAAMQYKRAVNLQKAGRDMVRVAEERLSSATDKFDVTWQEMLNQATSKVNEASREKDRIHSIHMKATKVFKSTEEDRNRLQVSLQRSIVKSKPYFEVQHDFQTKLEATTKRLNILEVRLLEARQSYSDALASIRQSGEGSSIALNSLAERGMGVGAENPLGDGSILPKPMQDFLRLEGSDATKSQNNGNSGDAESIMKKSRFRYNPYDLMYLNDMGSESGSAVGSSNDDYIQDF